MTPDDHTMSFGEHLEELRRRLIYALVVPLPLAILLFLVSDTLITWLVLPLRTVQEAMGEPTGLQTLSPPELLMTKIKISVVAALIMSAPWMLWQVWLFVRPGLYQKELRFVRFLIPGSIILTIGGLALMYFIMLPLMLGVLITIGSGINTGAMPADVAKVLDSQPTIQVVVDEPQAFEAGDSWLLVPEMKLYVAVPGGDGEAAIVKHVNPADRGLVSNEFQLSSYIGFVLLLFLGIAIAFQMPLVVWLLGLTGLVSPKWLQSRRRYALLVCGIVSAMITPADVISMVAMLIPLYGLYELGILLIIIAPAEKVASGTVISSLTTRSAPEKPDLGGPPVGAQPRGSTDDDDHDDERERDDA